MKMLQLKIVLSSRPCMVYMQDGFFNNIFQENIPHKHQYAEVYIVTKGAARLRVAKERYDLGIGCMVIVPPGKFHNVYNIADNSMRIAFQISLPVNNFYSVQVPDPMLEMLEAEIQKYVEFGDDRLLSPWLSLICSLFPCFQTEHISPIEDRQFLLYEYLSLNYNKEISMHNIADLLNVSDKQASRLVKQYSGNSFRDELTKTRIEVATHLSSSTKFTLAEIAEIVGFHSYSGFWKAFKKNQDIRSND